MGLREVTEGEMRLLVASDMEYCSVYIHTAIHTYQLYY